MRLLIDESVLMDLKALLVEAKQKAPPVLQVLQTGDETMLDIGGELFTPNVLLACLSKLACTSLKTLLCNFITVHISNICASCFDRREGLYILRWSWSSHHRLSQAGGHADQAGLQPRAERLPGS